MNLRFTAVVIVVLCLGVPSLESIGARAQSACQSACSAASSGNDAAILALLQQGNNLCNCPCAGGVLNAAVSGNCGHCFHLLTVDPGNCGCSGRDSAGNSPLHRAAGVCNIPITNRAITAGCNANEENNAGDTPLCRAVMSNSDNCGAVVQDLIGAGADPCIECAGGQTPCQRCVGVTTNACNVLRARGGCNC